MKKTFVILALTGAITACGGSESNSSQKQPPKETPPAMTTQTGVLTDGIVSGVSYETNRGLKGITNEKGEFKYNNGDKVRFSIGDVQLGDEIIAQARVTPLDLAQDEDSRTNLLVFLQTLDSDANHDNGISISNKATEAFKNQTINFKQSYTDFISNTSFKQALVKAEVKALVTPEKAKENFQKAFYKEIAGVWQFFENINAKTPDVLLYIAEDGTYYLGEFNPKDHVGQPGIEVGQLNWNALNTKLSPNITIDTNGEWGLSHPQGYHTLNLDGSNLIIGEPDIKETYIGTKVVNKNDNIVGSWIFSDGGREVFAFLENGTYLMLDPSGNDESCNSKVGIELGEYTLNNAELKIHNISIDTNDCAGLSDTTGIGQTLRFKVEADKFTLLGDDNEDGSAILNRIQ